MQKDRKGPDTCGVRPSNILGFFLLGQLGDLPGEVPFPTAVAVGDPGFHFCPGKLNSPGHKALLPAKRLYAPVGAARPQAGAGELRR